MNGLDARGPRELRGDFRHDDGFRERLRSDLHDGEQREHHRNRSSGARCAWTNRATYASAGEVESSSNVPSCAMRPSCKSTMRWAKKAASPRSCVTSTTVLRSCSK